jgi:hypothetical protein
MSQEKVLQWKDRLKMADRLWDRHGLTTRHEQVSPHWVTLTSLLNMYRNITFMADWGGIPHEELIEVPSGFSLVNTLMSQMYARNPILDVSAHSDQQKRNATNMEALQNTLIRTRNLGWKRQLNRALLHALITPGSFIRHGYTPREEMFSEKNLTPRQLERFQAAKPDVPWIRSWPIWDVRVDPTCSTFDPRGDVWWIAFRSLVPMQDIRDNPNRIARKDLRATRTIDERVFLGNSVSTPTKEEMQLVEIWTVYEARERTFFEISEGSDLTLREPERWPLEWENLPYTFLGFNEQLDTPFPIPPMSIVADQILERNKLRTMMSQLVKRMRRVVAVAEQALSETQRSQIEGDDPDLKEFMFFQGNQTGDSMREVQLGTFEQSLLLYDDRLTEDMREALGQSLLSRGQRINVDTAAEAHSVQAGSDLQTGRLAGPWEDFLSDVFATIGDGLQSPGVIQDAISVPILGRQDARELFGSVELNPFKRIAEKELRGSFMYEVRAGSTTPRNPAEDAQTAQRNLEFAAAQGPESFRLPQFQLDWILANDLDPEKYMQNAQQIAQLRAQLASGELAGQPEQKDPGAPVPLDLITGGGGGGGQPQGGGPPAGSAQGGGGVVGGGSA